VAGAAADRARSEDAAVAAAGDRRVNAFAARMERVAQTPRTVGWLGIVLGTLAFWLSLPPVEARAPWVPLIVGLLAASCGVWAVSRGVGRLGWGAVAVGVIGIALGVLATRSSSGNLHSVVTWGSLIGSTLVWATPLAYAAVGGMINERSGVVNIGLEGMMLAGAFFGCLGADKFGSWEMGVLTAAVAGGGFALLHAFFAIHLRADQIVGGTAINFLALGVTGYFFIQVYGANGTPGNLPRVPDANIPGLKQHTFFGDAIGHLNYMIWASFALLIVAQIVIFHTPIGLRLRAVGEHPRAADTVGISVYKTRYLAVVTSGILAALGGAYLSIGYVGSFGENMTAGRGFIALAAVIFGNWRPFGAYAAAILFGASTALSFRLAVYSDAASVLFQALPYVLTLIAVAGVIGRSIPPASVGRPYAKQ
jgi:general nucleoside transport system permease protein